MTDKFKGFPLFNEVEREELRTWNRCSTLFNINHRHGKELAKEYTNQFSKPSRMKMLMMYNYISNRGYEEVKREINRGDFRNTGAVQ